MNNLKYARLAACVVFLTVPARASQFIMRGGNLWGVRITTEILKEFAIPRQMGRADFDFLPWTDKQNVEQFAADKCDILVHRTLPLPHDKELLIQRFPLGGPQPEIAVIAYGQVAVVVDPNNPLRSLSLDQVKSILRMKGGISNWKDLDLPGGVIKSYGEKDEGTSRLIVRHACMMLDPNRPTFFYAYRDDFQRCEDDDEVMGKVARNPNGIGFFLYHGQPLKGVKLVPIGATDKGPFVLPSSGAVIQNDYPLQEPLVLYLHPNAPPLAKEFCEFAAGKEGSDIMAKMGLLTTYASAAAEADQRLADMKAGKGERITAVGSPEMAQSLRDLAGQYTYDRATVQMGYLSDSGTEAVEEFTRGKDLLLLPGKVDDMPLPPAAKSDWNDRFKQANGKCVCARAAAVVVNAVNPLASMSSQQLAEILSGKSRDWKEAGTKADPQAKSAIDWYNAGADDPALMLAGGKLKLRALTRAIRRGSEQECIESVASDPQGIAVVSMAELPADLVKAGIRVLPIGEPNGAVAPDPATVTDGSYPLATRYFMYEGASGGAVSKDFAHYLISSSAATDILRKDGFICASVGPSQN